MALETCSASWSGPWGVVARGYAASYSVGLYVAICRAVPCTSAVRMKYPGTLKTGSDKVCGLVSRVHSWASPSEEAKGGNRDPGKCPRFANQGKASAKKKKREKRKEARVSGGHLHLTTQASSIPLFSQDPPGCLLLFLFSPTVQRRRILSVPCLGGRFPPQTSTKAKSPPVQSGPQGRIFPRRADCAWPGSTNRFGRGSGEPRRASKSCWRPPPTGHILSRLAQACIVNCFGGGPQHAHAQLPHFPSRTQPLFEAAGGHVKQGWLKMTMAPCPRALSGGRDGAKAEEGEEWGLCDMAPTLSTPPAKKAKQQLLIEMLTDP